MGVVGIEWVEPAVLLVGSIAAGGVGRCEVAVCVWRGNVLNPLVVVVPEVVVGEWWVREEEGEDSVYDTSSYTSSIAVNGLASFPIIIQ